MPKRKPLSDSYHLNKEEPHEIHKIAYLRDPEKLHDIIEFMLEKDPKANLNPFIVVSQITRGGYDVASLLKRPDPRKRRLEDKDNPPGEYSFECEKILSLRMALQTIDEENPLTAVLKKIVKNNYDFEYLNYSQLREIRKNENIEYDPDSKEVEDIKNKNISIFCNLCCDQVTKCMKEILEMSFLTNDPESSLTNNEPIFKFALQQLSQKPKSSTSNITSVNKVVDSEATSSKSIL